MNDNEMHLDTNSKFLDVQSKISKSFKVTNIDFIPGMLMGAGKVLSTQNSLKDHSRVFHVTTDSFESFAGVNFEILSKFSIKSIPIETFAHMSLTQELGERKIIIDKETAYVSPFTSSFTFGLKTTIDLNSKLFATANFEKQRNLDLNKKIELGISIKM